MRKACLGGSTLNNATKQRECRVIAWVVCLGLQIRRGFPRWAQLLRAIDFFRDIRNLVGFAADETEQRRGERPTDLGVVHNLQSVAVGAQR